MPPIWHALVQLVIESAIVFLAITIPLYIFVWLPYSCIVKPFVDGWREFR